jgi:fatty-acyl-CoA synthase
MSATSGPGWTLVDIVENNRQSRPNAIAVIQGDTELTWGEFGAMVDRVRQSFARLGVGRGDRVAVLDRNCIEFVALQYGLSGLGAVIVPISWRFTSREVAYVVDNCRPSVLVTGAEFLATVREAIADLAVPPTLVVRDAGDLESGERSWTGVMEAAEPVAESRPESWNDPHMILYTSGTTGFPKGAVISHRRTLVDALSTTAALGVRPGQRFLCYMPLFHTGSWDYIKLYFLGGGSVVLMDRFDPDEAVRLIARHRCNGMFAVPLVLLQMLECDSFQGADLSSMRLIAYCSYDPSDLILDVARAFHEAGASQMQVSHIYGLTESGPCVAITPPDRGLEAPRSVGIPAPGVTVRLLDDDIRPVGPGEVGEVCVRSQTLMDGYLNNPAATEEALAGGWLHTGDMGRFDDEGRLYIVDRKKDMIRTAGENVYPKEVEQVLITHPSVRECAVVGRPDERYEERVVAFVVPEPGREIDEAEILAYLRRHLAGYKCPRDLHEVTEIPKTPAGKVAKNLLRQQVSPTDAVTS